MVNNGGTDMKKLVQGMRFKVKEVNNPLIKTEVGNIVEIVVSNEKSTEFVDLMTFDWFIVDNEDIDRYLEKCQ